MLGTRIIFINEGIDMNTVVFDDFLNTAVPTSTEIQCAHHLQQSSYIEARIDVGT